jgi:hypothetical protein
MKIPVFIVSIFLTAILSVQGWMAIQIVDLKADTASIKTAIADLQSSRSSLAHSDSTDIFNSPRNTKP